MVDGDTAVDKSISGLITNESIALSTVPTGSTYSWGISKPSGATARSDISSATDATPSFTPDVAGYWIVTCTVDSTTSYVIRISVTQTAVTTSYEAIRFSPKTAASVPAPTVGSAVYHDTTTGLLSRKIAGGAVKTIETRAYTPTGSADAAGNTGDVAFDASFVYVKTASGWRRATLSSF